jgi:hypothetical protein
VDRILDAFTKYLKVDASWQDDFTWGKMIHTGHGCWTVQESVRPPHWNTLRDKEFEWFLKEVFQKLGYHVEMTKASGDQGVDLIVSGHGRRIAVQVKGYANKVGNDAVQQVHSGMTYHKCQECAVITNNRFSRSARELAASVGCTLIGRDDMEDLIAGRHPFAKSIETAAPSNIPGPGHLPQTSRQERAVRRGTRVSDFVSSSCPYVRSGRRIVVATLLLSPRRPMSRLRHNAKLRQRVFFVRVACLANPQSA